METQNKCFCFWNNIAQCSFWSYFARKLFFFQFGSPLGCIIFFKIVIQKSKTISQIELQQLTDSNMLFDNSVKVIDSVVIQLSWDVVGVTPLDSLPGPHKKTSNLTVTPTDKLAVEEKSLNTWRTCKLHRVKP